VVHARSSSPTPMSVHFKDGKKFVDGREILRVGFRESLSSNGVTVYTACAWADGTTSCNCTGWATSKKTPKSCKHSLAVHPGDARILRDTDADERRAFNRLSATLEAHETRVEAPKKGRKIILGD
jgi:hypothetical protein